MAEPGSRNDAAQPERLFTREEAQAGLPARRAHALLFLIESRAAHLAARSHHALELFSTDEAARRQDLAFLEAFAEGRDPPVHPTIQDIERHAASWAPLVPASPTLRAAVARLLGEKYRFTRRATRGIQAALGLDDEAVRRAHQRLFGEPIEAIFIARPTPLERLGWTTTAVARWLDALPPFWTVVILTVALPLPSAILATPIAVAGIGPLAGVGLILALGVVNVVTMACMAEAVARSGLVRYSTAFLGRLAADYLGSIGSSLLTAATATLFFCALLASFIGVADTLASFTSVRAEVWALPHLLGVLYTLLRKGARFTLSVMVFLAAINIALIVAVSLIALTNLQLETLFYLDLPFQGGRSLQPSSVQRLFGVLLILFFAQGLMTQVGRAVLPRDSDGRSLIWGSIAGTVCSTLLYGAWTAVVGGAVAPGDLAGWQGTVVTPLAERVGSGTELLGSILVVLLLGQTAIRCSVVLFNLVGEWLPSRQSLLLALPRRKGQLIFQPRRSGAGTLRIGVTYLGQVGGQPTCRLDLQTGGETRRVETPLNGSLDAASLLGPLPADRAHRPRLILDVVDATDEYVRLRVDSSMSVAYQGDWNAPGLHLADLIVLPDAERLLLAWMVRRGAVTLAEVAARTGRAEGDARRLLDALVDEGFARRVEGGDGPRYHSQLAPRRARRLPAALDPGRESNNGAESRDGRARDDAREDGHIAERREPVLAFGETGRILLSVSPAVVGFLIAEWMLSAGEHSFARVLAFAGVVAISLISGILPILLLVSSRRKGELSPRGIVRALDHRLVVAIVYGSFLAIIFVHGLFIWQSSIERVGAIAIGVFVLVSTIAMVRRGAFAPRLVLEVRDDATGGAAAWSLSVGGRPIAAEVRVDHPDGGSRFQAADDAIPTLSSVRSLSFDLPVGVARELKVWIHRITPSGDSESLPALLDVDDGNATRRFDVKLLGGQVIVPLSGRARLRITPIELAQSSPPV
jgi:hypothetical protein